MKPRPRIIPFGLLAATCLPAALTAFGPPASGPADSNELAPGRAIHAGGPQANASPTKPDDSPTVLQARYARRIRALRENMLDSSIERLRQRGRKEILAIEDPLVIDPLARELSRGGIESRILLLEALQRFSEPQASLNIAAIALADPDEGIAADARRELRHRADPSIVPHLREALFLDDDTIVSRAATALAALGARETVPFLIMALTAEKTKRVEVAGPRFDARWENYFPPGCAPIGAFPLHYPDFVMKSGVVAFLRSKWEVRDVTVMRTPVLEALKSLTGQNFGFDGNAWARWYNSQSRTAEDPR